MKKGITLVLAFVLCMSIGMISFAATSPSDPVITSPTDPSIPNGGATYTSPTDPSIPVISSGVSAKDRNGNDVTITAKPVSETVAQILQDETQVKDILKSAGYVLTGNEAIAVLGAADIELPEGTAFPEGGVDLSLNLSDFVGADDLQDLQDGSILYLLHQKKDGTWEVLEGTVSIKDGAYFVSAHFDSLSPVAVLKVMSDGKVAVLATDTTVGGPGTTTKVGEIDPATGKVTTTSTVKKSPKTGA